MDLDADMSGVAEALCPIHTIEAPGVVAADPKKKATRKASAKAKASADVPKTSKTRKTAKNSSPAAAVNPSGAHDAASRIGASRHGSDAAPAASPNGEADQSDELANAICLKLGGDGTAVKNLDPARILRGEQLGRTVQGVTWCISSFLFCCFLLRGLTVRLLDCY